MSDQPLAWRVTSVLDGTLLVYIPRARGFITAREAFAYVRGIYPSNHQPAPGTLVARAWGPGTDRFTVREEGRAA